MTPRMKAFLTEASECEPGKGCLVDGHDFSIASKATRDGYGMIIHALFGNIFVVSEVGRDALAQSEGR